ncbi:MAG: DNA cytosine methyltransferase [candidate division Zixibacteria bacterium]|nr:DNA cytosine methyltransferase [candidate division Zixibacteria bacterium]
MKVIDLFCGAGGFSEGFRQAGFEIILGVDNWGDAIETYAHNQKCDVLESDIKDVTYLPDCDIIIGSPPCQNFSSLNTKKNPCDGLKLIHEFERIVELNRPKYWVWENVEPVKRFYPHASILNSWDFGLAQRRKRAFITSFPFFIMGHLEGKWTPPYGYDGHLASNKGKAGWAHKCRSGTVRTKPIRNLETNEFLMMDEVKELMGFPIDYEFFGTVTSQRKQIGNAVCPPVARAIAEGLINEIQYDSDDSKTA